MTDHAYVERREGPRQSQHGEDAWLARYFGGRRSGFFIEIGAYDGIVISNTYYFEQIGWTGILVEPHPEKARLCRANRPHSRVFECAAVSSPHVATVELLDVPGGEVYSTVVPSEYNLGRLRNYGLSPRPIVVRARTLDSILEETRPTQIDFVSIDVEGSELEVLEGFDIQRWKPRVIILESPTRRPPKIREYFVRNGYVYLRSIGINDIYARLPLRLPDRHRSLAAVAIDGFWYPFTKMVNALRQRASLRTRLRNAGLWKRS